MADKQEEKNTSRAAPRSEYEPEENRGFTDASYIPRDEAPRIPHIYQNVPPVPKAERESDQRAITVPLRTVLILCAVCVLGGVAAGLAASERSMAFPKEVAVETIPTPEPTAAAQRAEATAAPVQESAMSSETVYESVSDSVVGIAVQGEGKNALGASTRRAVTGTGFILTGDGYIVTSYETVRAAAENGDELCAVLKNGRRVPAELVGAETGEGGMIAVLKIEERGLPAVRCGDLSGAEVGSAVYVIGNPLGELTETMRRGMISAPQRTITTAQSPEENKAIRVFQIDLAGVPGEGAAVFSDEGELLGFMTGAIPGAEENGFGFAVPVNDAAAAAHQIIERGDVPGAPYMGVVVQTVSRTVAEYYNQFKKDSMVVGAQVYSVEEDCCAALAGLCRGDIITRVGDVDIASAAELTAAVNDYRTGDEAEITFFRDGEYMTATIVFDEKAEG